MESLGLLAGIAGLPLEYIVAGIIGSLALGFAAGNYACSLVHRLPRGKSVLEHKPYCGSCNTPLATRDLFPVLSALLLRHKCRYCGAPFPTSHTWTEVLIGLLFTACFLQFNFSEDYFLVAAIGVFLITAVFIEINDKMVVNAVVLTLLTLGAIFRALHDHELSNFFMGGLMALLIAAYIWRKQIHKHNHRYVIPGAAKLLTASGVIIGLRDLPVMLVLLLAAWLLTRPFKAPFSVQLALASMAVLLIPGLQLYALLGAQL